MKQQSKVSMLASSVVPKFKGLPIIFKGLPIFGIIGLLIVSTLIYRDSIFIEQGLPTFGDFDFPYPDIFLESSFYLWYEGGMQFHGIWQLPRWIILYTIWSLVGEQLFVKLGLALAHFAPAIVGGSVVCHLLYQRNLLDSRTKKEVVFFIAGLALISTPMVTNNVGISFFGLSLISEYMIAFPLFVYALLSTKRMLFRSLLIFAGIIVTFGGGPRETIYYLLLIIPPLVILSLIDRRKLRNTFFNVGILSALVISLSTYAWLPPALEGETLRPGYLLNQSGLSSVSLDTFSVNQELSNSFRGLQKWWSIGDFSTENPILYNAWFISSWAIPIIAFSSFLIIKDTAIRKLVVVLGSLSVILLFLVKGVNPPWGEFYSWLVLEAPLPLGLNWIFRESAKFYIFYAFPIAFLLAITLLRIISSTAIMRQTIPVIALTICLVLYAWPLYTGNFKGLYHLTEPPDEYMAIREMLSNTEGNILWVPPDNKGNFTWQRTPVVQDPSFLISPNPVFPKESGQSDIWDNIQIGLRQDQDALLKYLEITGVRYIVLRNDVLSDDIATYETLLTFESFLNHAGAKAIYNGKSLRAFQLPSNTSYIYGYPQIVNGSVVNDVLLTELESESYFNAWSEVKLSVRSAAALWKVVGSPLIEVDPDLSYFMESKTKAQNTHEGTLMIAGVDSDHDVVSLDTIGVIGGVISDGNTSDGQLITDKFLPSGDSVRYVQFQIWYGKDTDQPLPNEIPLEFLRFGTTMFTNEFYEPQTLSYEKIDPTKYIVDIPKSLESQVVVFPQIFDSLWVAKIDGKEYRPSSLYNSINAFLVDKHGTMEILYKPQQAFYSAALISLISLGVAVAYSTYEWRSKRMMRKSIY
jgi:hypothetical protein